MRQSPNHWLALTSLLLVAVMGASILTLLPLWVGALTDAGGYSQQQIGWLAAADVIGIFAASASAIFWVRRLPWRPLVLVGLSVFLLANLASLAVQEVYGLMFLRVLAGLGCGTAYAIALAGLGDHSRPDFAFGLMVTAQVAFGTLGFFIAPEFIARWSVDGFFHYLNIWLLLAFIACAICLPVSQKPDTGQQPLLRSLFKTNAVLVFSITVIYYCGVSAVWAYLERMGIALGLSGDEVGNLLGLGFAISGAGSFVAPFVARFTGKLPAYCLAMALQILAMLWLVQSPFTLPTLVLYGAATIIFQFFWSFAVPLLMDRFNSVDSSGRLIVLCASAFKIGEIAGPPLAAALIVGDNYSAVLWLGVGTLIVSALLMAWLEIRLKAKPAELAPCA